MGWCTSMKTSSPASKLGFVTEGVHQLVREGALRKLDIILVCLFLILRKHNQLLRDLGGTERDLLVLGSSRTRTSISILISQSVCSRGVDPHWTRVDRAIGSIGTIGGVKGALCSGGVGKQLARVRKRTGRDKLDMVLVLVMVGCVGGGSLLALLLLAALEEWRPGIGRLLLLVCHDDCELAF